MSSPHGVEYWVRYLSQSEMPALSHVIVEINQVCSSDEGSAAQLAELILKDASLTSRILKVANSVHYNPNVRKPISTVSRAVVLLGLSGIKSILLMTMFIEHALKNGDKKRMLSCLAKALHRAVQAKFLLDHVMEADAELLEEVFIYGLVYDVAEMAFWGSRHGSVKALEAGLATGKSEFEMLQEDILGTNFQALSRGLVKVWKLGAGFEELFAKTKEPSQKVQSILLADEICRASEQGWAGKNISECLPKLAQFIGMNIEDTRVLLKDRADSAADVAASYGADEIGRLIPNSDFVDSSGKVEPAGVGDSALQLEILREMNTIEKNALDVNALFHMLLEGVHRGIGLERVGIFIINKSLTAAVLKYAVGEGIDEWKKGLQISVSENDGSIFSSCIHQQETLWLKPDNDKQWLKILNKSDCGFMDNENALIASIYTGKRAVALIVSDRGEGGKAIDHSQHDNFCYFTEQACQSLSALVK